MKKIFLIHYQPKEKSDKQDYVNTFIEESKKAGNEVRILNLHSIDVEYLKIENNIPAKDLTPELKEAQDNIIWADQLVVVFSVWCLNVPAKFKAFIERVFQADILVGYGKMGPEPILKNKTLVVMQSYAMPKFIMKYFYGDLTYKFIKVVFDTWCGFKIVKRFDIDTTENISEKKHNKIISEIKKFCKKN